MSLPIQHMPHEIVLYEGAGVYVAFRDTTYSFMTSVSIRRLLGELYRPHCGVRMWD